MIYDINLVAVFIATLSTFLLGGLWYSPLCFGNTWKKEAGIGKSESKKHSAHVFIVSFLLSLLSVIGMTLLLRKNSGFFMALHTGFLIGVCWVATSFGVNYAFAGRSFKLFLIDSGYHITQFTLYGFVLGIIPPIF